MEVKTFDSVNAFLDAKIVEAPSCLITEVSVDGASAGTLVRDMRNHGLATPVVVLADGEHSLHSAVDAIKAGAADFIEESIGERHFVERIKAIINADK